MTYATDLFTGDGSTVEFTVTFDYIQRDHVKVYRVVTATEAETELTVITSGDPSDDEYVWESNTKIKVGTAPTTEQELKIVRETPKDEQLVDWKDGSYIVAADLNTADLQLLYDIQELDDRVSELDTESIKFLGTVDLTTDDPPANPSNGDLFVNTGDGTVKEGWTGIVGDDVSGAEQVLWIGTDEEWSIVDTPASQSGVLGVTGTAPITVDNTDDQNPVVGIDAATTSAAGSMSSADKTKLDGVATGAEVNVNADWDATSGDAEILNKPTIPAAQVQSDWNQTDAAAVDFIENKPDILDDAPSDGNTYGREDGAWVEVTGAVTSIVAGTNITIDPAGGTGDVTINSSGGASDTWERDGTTVQLVNSGDDVECGPLTASGNITTTNTVVTNYLDQSNSTTTNSNVVSNFGNDNGTKLAVRGDGLFVGSNLTSLNAGSGPTNTMARVLATGELRAGNPDFSVSQSGGCIAQPGGVLQVKSAQVNENNVAFGVYAGDANARASITGAGDAEFKTVSAANTAKMWINFNGTGTVSIRDSFNVDSITDNGTGDYTITFTDAMPNNNYCVVASSGTTAGITLYNSSPQTGSVRIDSVNYAGGNEDNAQQHVAIFAD